MPSALKTELKAARQAIDAEDYDVALAHCREALKLDRECYNAYVLAGVASRGKGDVERALIAYNKAVKLRPELALAYRGILDALQGDDIAERTATHYAQIATAQYALSRIQPDAQDDAIRQAAQNMHQAAVLEWEYYEDAVRFWTEAYEKGFGGLAPRAAYPIAQLLSAHDRMLQHPEAVAAFVDAARETGVCTGYDSVMSAILEVERVRLQQGTTALEDTIVRLQQLEHHSGILELAESDKGLISPDCILRTAQRELHWRPAASGTRACAHIAHALLTVRANDKAALRMLGAATAQTSRRHASNLLPDTITHALVQAAHHLRQHENKLARKVAGEGLRCTKSEERMTRAKAVFSLMSATACARLKMYKDSLTDYRVAGEVPSTDQTVWICASAHRGEITTTAAAFGKDAPQFEEVLRRVEQSDTAAKYDARLAMVWREALAGRIDCNRATEIANDALQQYRQSSEDEKTDEFEGSSSWEQWLLGPRITGSLPETTAMAWMRVGQMQTAACGVKSKDMLVTAQSYFMHAASLCPRLADPFAYLGWVMEELSLFEKRQSLPQKHVARTVTRAIRCYEKCLTRLSSHELGAKRLTRIFKECGSEQDAVVVAELVTVKNPRAFWAWNILGWAHLAEGRASQAIFSFQSALRGGSKVVDGHNELFFGIMTWEERALDNALVTADSWWGLGAAYKLQGKLGPAVSCLEDALKVLCELGTSKGCHLSTLGTSLDRYSLRVRAELASVQQDIGVSAHAAESLQHLAKQPRAPCTIYQYLCDVHLDIAARHWLAGCYHSATMSRVSACRYQQTAILRASDSAGHVNIASMHKHLGDASLCVATNDPGALAKLVDPQTIENAIKGAVMAYSRGFHLEPWNLSSRGRDLGIGLAALGSYLGSNKILRSALRLVAYAGADLASVGAVLYSFGKASGSDGVLKSARVFLGRLARRTPSHGQGRTGRIGLKTALAELAVATGDLSRGAQWSVESIRDDPTDSRG